MKPLVRYPCSISISILILSLLIPINCEDDSPYYTNCNNAFTCGDSNIKTLKYPFFGGNRDWYCGQPGLDLICEDTAPKMNINSIKYRILDWDDTTQKLTVARDDYYSTSVCSVSDYKNTSFDNTSFQIQYDSGFVTLLYGCTSTENFQNQNPYPSDCGENKTVYYVLAPLYSPLCSASIVIPILGQQVVSSNRIDDALKQGFELRWTGDYKQCTACMESGGECGYYDSGEFRCFCKDGPHTSSCTSQMASPPGSSSKRNLRLQIVIGASAAGFGATIFFVWIICYHKRRMTFAGKRRMTFQQKYVFEEKKYVFEEKRKYVDHNVEAFMKSYGSFAPRRYRYSEVKRIANSFLNKLGEGGYGVVYKARLSDGRPVAVKVISESKGNGEEFINEVASISRTSHVNIVSLLGFCYDMNKRVLIYEFMPNGSLDNFINKTGSPNVICHLDCNMLYKVALGVARGLEYLHRGCNTRILHLDIKPQNILLDEDFCPKISDFGLAKICQKKESIVSILGTRGTPGYIAPEMFSRAFGGVSHKSDVYSYGMLILEMVGGRKNCDNGGSHTSEMYFPDWIYKDLEQGNIHTNYLVITEEENEMVRKITLVSLWCIQTNPSDRPSMSKVVEMLEGPLQQVPYPPKPVLYSLERSPLQISDISSDNMQETNSITTQKDGSMEFNE